MKRTRNENRYQRNDRSWRMAACWRSAAFVSCLALLLAGWLFFGTARASAMTSYIDAQPESAEVGQDVTVTVVFSGDNVGRVRATLEYDTSVLSYQGDGGDTGEVSLYMASSGDGIYYSLPFKAAGEGTSTLLLTPLDAYDMDEMSLSLPESQAMTVSVEAAPAEEPEEPEKTEPEDKDQTEDPEENPDSGQTAEPDQNDQQEAEPAAPAEPEEPAEPAPARSSATIWVLAGLAAIVAVCLIIVLARRSSGRKH